MSCALIIVDVQRAIDDPSWGDDRNNRDAEANIARLLARRTAVPACDNQSKRAVYVSTG